MNERKYPLSLFVFGFITNVLFRFFWLFIPSIILLIIGSFIESCLYIGLALLILDLILSLIEQLKIYQAALQESDNPDFCSFQDALSKDGNWRQNVMELVDKKTKENKGSEE